MQQDTPPDKEEIGDGLDQAHIQSVIEAVEAGDVEQLTELLEPLHAADVADLIEQISQAERRALVELWGDEINGEILSELHESVREPMLEVLPPDVVAEAIRDMDSDDVVDLVEDLEEE
ncbi:MAG TPA: hypothetical protein VK972_09625, partial [Wenzhouxiangella sp.]|nr:hypothetical protein [Wenzhouxiangella sp.]